MKVILHRFFPQELNFKQVCSKGFMFKGELFVVIQTTSKYFLLDVQQKIGVCLLYMPLQWMLGTLQF